MFIILHVKMLPVSEGNRRNRHSRENHCQQTQSGGDTGLRGVSVSTVAIPNRHIYFIILNVLFKKKITATLEMI